MPIYEYICEKCGGHLEVTQRMADAPLTTHNIESSCGGPLKKIISMNAFHLKGTGWYKTDYPKSSSSNSAPTSTSSNESSDKSSKPSDSGEGKKESSESKGSQSKGSEDKSSSKESTSTPTPAAKPGAGGKD